LGFFSFRGKNKCPLFLSRIGPRLFSYMLCLFPFLFHWPLPPPFDWQASPPSPRYGSLHIKTALSFFFPPPELVRIQISPPLGSKIYCPFSPNEPLHMETVRSYPFPPSNTTSIGRHSFLSCFALAWHSFFKMRLAGSSSFFRFVIWVPFPLSGCSSVF